MSAKVKGILKADCYVDGKLRAKGDEVEVKAELAEAFLEAEVKAEKAEPKGK